jgi:hypothetical protein
VVEPLPTAAIEIRIGKILKAEAHPDADRCASSLNRSTRAKGMLCLLFCVYQPSSLLTMFLLAAQPLR